MIKNIIFDIGNVLADFGWREFLQEKGFDEAMLERIAKASVLSPIWKELDRGVWTDEELMEGFIAQDPEIADELRRAYRNMTGMAKLREYACPWVKELKAKGYGVYYLSNFPKRMRRECAGVLDFVPLTDGGILSYEVKLIKPDKEIYQLLLSQFDLQAEECVFFDDTLKNVEAAKELGIHGILFHTKEQAEEELRALGME